MDEQGVHYFQAFEVNFELGVAPAGMFADIATREAVIVLYLAWIAFLAECCRIAIRGEVVGYAGNLANR